MYQLKCLDESPLYGDSWEADADGAVSLLLLLGKELLFLLLFFSFMAFVVIEPTLESFDDDKADEALVLSKFESECCCRCFALPWFEIYFTHAFFLAFFVFFNFGK